jgi:hypothetical protein
VKRALAVAVLAVAGLSFTPSASAAGSVTAIGWWTRSPIASAPEGGFTVGNAPDGPLSVAAVGVDLGDDGMTSATLSFEQVGGQPPAAGQLVACVIGSFQAASAGPIADAPATTCDSTQAPVAINGTVWTVNVGELVGESRGTVGIALVPATGSASVWDVQFDKAAFSGTAARPTTATTTARPTATTAPSSASRPATTFAVPQPPSVAAPRPTTTVAASTTPSTIAPVGTPDVVPNATASASTFSGNAGGNEPSGRPIGQAITLVMLATLIGIVAGIAHKVAASRAPA